MSAGGVPGDSADRQSERASPARADQDAAPGGTDRRASPPRADQHAAPPRQGQAPPRSGGARSAAPVGTLAEEVALLLDTLASGAASVLDVTARAGPREEATEGTWRCRGCPLCRWLDTVQSAGTGGRSPLADAVGTVLAALRDCASAPVPRARADPPRHPPPGTPDGGLVRIDIT